MVIPMPDRDPESTPSQAKRLGYGVNVRLTPAQQRGVEMLAEQRETNLSEVIRAAIDGYLSSFEDSDGVTLLELLEREVASERVSAKRLAALARAQA